MLNRSASLAMSTSVLKALPDKLDSKDTHLVFSICLEIDKVYQTTHNSAVNMRGN